VIKLDPHLMFLDYYKINIRKIIPRENLKHYYHGYVNKRVSGITFVDYFLLGDGSAEKKHVAHRYI
jgi:hypothetical protein